MNSECNKNSPRTRRAPAAAVGPFPARGSRSWSPGQWVSFYGSPAEGAWGLGGAAGAGGGERGLAYRGRGGATGIGAGDSPKGASGNLLPPGSRWARRAATENFKASPGPLSVFHLAPLPRLLPPPTSFLRDGG